MNDKPKIQLVGQDGNIFGILGRASSLLRKVGQPEQATEMRDCVFASGSYDEALRIVSEYVETDLSAGGRTPVEPPPELSLFDKAEIIAHWEQENCVPEEKRITRWYGDYHLYEPKFGVSEEQISRTYREIKAGGKPIKKKKETHTHER